MQKKTNIYLEYLIYISSIENISLESKERDITYPTAKLIDIVKRFLNKFIKELNGQLKELNKSYKKISRFNTPVLSKPNISFKTYVIDYDKTIENLNKCLSYYKVMNKLLEDGEWAYNRIEFDALDNRHVLTIKKEYDTIVTNTYDNKNINSLVEMIFSNIENMENIMDILNTIGREINTIKIKKITISNTKDRTPIEILNLLNDILLSIIKSIFNNIKNYNKVLTFIKDK